MAMQPPPAPPSGGAGPAPDQQAPAMPPVDDQTGPFTQMIISTDQALTGISQLLAKASPQAANAMAQLNEQYRKIIQSVLAQQTGGQGGPAAASPMVDPMSQGKPTARMAY